jgi:hypothetical protein
MLVAVDFDGTLVLDLPGGELELRPFVREGVLALRRAGHRLILFSVRANPSLWEDWQLNPLWVQGVLPFDELRWQAERQEHLRRYEQMVAWVERELPSAFALVYSGLGKPVGVDLYIDDKSLVIPGTVGVDWLAVAEVWGEPACG